MLTQNIEHYRKNIKIDKLLQYLVFLNVLCNFYLYNIHFIIFIDLEKNSNK